MAIQLNKTLQTEINKYIKEIKSLVFCNSKTLKGFLNDFKNDILNYVDENNVTDILNVIQHFGTPEEVAKGFLESTDLKKIKKRIQIKNFILVAIIVFILIWALSVTFATLESLKSVNGYFVENSAMENMIHINLL